MPKNEYYILDDDRNAKVFACGCMSAVVIVAILIGVLVVNWIW